jgi:peptide/nickel transport system substrate-binding protein
MAFSWDVARHPELISSISNSGLVQADSIEVTDPHTFVMTWKMTYAGALQLTWRELWVFPRHILGEAFAGDKQAFRALPYFTTSYVQMGPYRLTDCGMGDQQIFERFDQYFLGRPKVNRIIIRTITNANTLLANLKAGAIDMASEKILPSEAAIALRAEWEQSGEGSIVSRQDNWAYIGFQFDPALARPAEMRQDPRIRRGLFQAIDREAIREFAFSGLPDTNGDTFMLASDPRGKAVGMPFARHPYNRTAALQVLADAGWTRSADGRLIDQAGQQVQIQVKSEDERWAQEVAAIADYWRQLGIDATEYVPSRTVARDREQRATFPGVNVRARGSGEDVFGAFDSRMQATAQNRWQGGNLSHYANPALDRLLDRLNATLDEQEQAVAFRDIGEIMATDLPALPLYFAVTFAAVRKDVRALRDDFSTLRNTGVLARNAHLWERE